MEPEGSIPCSQYEGEGEKRSRGMAVKETNKTGTTAIRREGDKG
jgi:hypothetical protein